MSGRKTIYVVGGAIGCLALLFCIGVFALVGVQVWGGNMALFARPVDRIAYVDNNLNIQVVDPRGENHVALTSDATVDNDLAYLFPTWSPDSQRLAYVRLNGTEDTFEGTLFSTLPSGGKPTTAFSSTTNMPFYLYWSPDNQHISFLTQSDTEINLMLAQADGKEDARTLDTGSPFYWAWSPDGRTLLTHVGGSQRDSSKARLAFLRWQGNNASQSLSSVPASFLAPQFSPDGNSILYASSDTAGKDALYVADAQGGNSRLIANYDGHVAFSWSPTGKKIAWVATPEDATLPNLGPLSVSDNDGKNVKKMGSDDALAFYWSPDGKQIAYLSLIPPGSQGLRVPGLSAPLDQRTPLRMRWRIADVETGQSRTLVTFAPTANFITLVPYFDQYARSVTFWSPDSKRFVYAQRESQGAGSVWVTEVTENAKPVKVGDGTLAVWSWK